jgi:hypothetical protein
MSRFLAVIFCASIFSCFNTHADNAFSRDPFEQTIALNCQRQTELLNKQIQEWQFKGIIQHIDSDYQQIWLSSDGGWLAITNNAVPHVLFPWMIQAVLSDKILWQANLPEYCHHQVLWTMQLTQ